MPRASTSARTVRPSSSSRPRKPRRRRPSPSATAAERGPRAGSSSAGPAACDSCAMQDCAVAERTPRSAMPSHSSRERGFALLEVLVAMLLVAVALLGVTGLQLAALRSGADLLRLLGASSHAAAHAERLRALHDAPPEAREVLATRGARRGCRDERRCTPLEFAEDEAARWLDEAQDA